VAGSNLETFVKRSFVFASFIALFATAAPLAAQERERGDEKIPPGSRPPAGMCRIWLDNVPAGQQPAPTDCATAVRNRPPNGRVIFGDERRGGGRSGGVKPKKMRGSDSAWRLPTGDRPGWGG
jgi:hypothetical protein